MNARVEINETCLTVAEVAERLKVNEETARRLFLNEPGVIVICYPRKGVRVYRTLRIPEGLRARCHAVHQGRVTWPCLLSVLAAGRVNYLHTSAARGELASKQKSVATCLFEGLR